MYLLCWNFCDGSLYFINLIVNIKIIISMFYQWHIFNQMVVLHFYFTDEMTGIVLPGVSFPIPGAPSLSLSKYRPHESSDSNPTQNPPIRPPDRDHNPLNPRSNKRSCFLCREKTDQTLDLGLRENVSCRLTLELVFERKLETKTVCHPCLSRFESLWSPIVEFKKIVPGTNFSTTVTKFLNRYSNNQKTVE